MISLRDPLQDPVLFRRHLLAWFLPRRRPLPWRELFARTADPFAIWVSEIMLQQTTIAAVIPKYTAFMQRFPNVPTLAEADEGEVRTYCSGLGYYRRFRSLHMAAKHLHEEWQRSGNSAWPSTLEAWLDLPGIGPYTAHAILSIAFQEPYAVVDGNVERIFCRLWDIQKPVNDPALKKEFQKSAAALLDPKAPHHFNEALMELGQTVCRKEAPDCGQCPVESQCLASARRTQHLAPQPKIRKEWRNVDLQIAVHWRTSRRGHEIFLHERAADSPFLRDIPGLKLSLGRAKKTQRVVGVLRHTITHHKISGQVILVESKQPGPELRGKWVPLADAAQQLTTSLDKKALRCVHMRLNSRG